MANMTRGGSGARGKRNPKDHPTLNFGETQRMQKHDRFVSAIITNPREVIARIRRRLENHTPKAKAELMEAERQMALRRHLRKAQKSTARIREIKNYLEQHPELIVHADSAQEVLARLEIKRRKKPTNLLFFREALQTEYEHAKRIAEQPRPNQKTHEQLELFNPTEKKSTQTNEQTSAQKRTALPEEVIERKNLRKALLNIENAVRTQETRLAIFDPPLYAGENYMQLRKTIEKKLDKRLEDEELYTAAGLTPGEMLEYEIDKMFWIHAGNKRENRRYKPKGIIQEIPRAAILNAITNLKNYKQFMPEQYATQRNP